MIMDPQETWLRLLAASVNNDWEEAEELANALLTWLEKGGFPPEVLGPKELGVEFNAALVHAACSFILRRADSVLAEGSCMPQAGSFSLICRYCSKERSGAAVDVIAEGWMGIEYVPGSISENLWGICPSCRAVRS